MWGGRKTQSHRWRLDNEDGPVLGLNTEVTWVGVLVFRVHNARTPSTTSSFSNRSNLLLVLAQKSLTLLADRHAEGEIRSAPPTFRLAASIFCAKYFVGIQHLRTSSKKPNWGPTCTSMFLMMLFFANHWNLYCRCLSSSKNLGKASKIK